MLKYILLLSLSLAFIFYIALYNTPFTFNSSPDTQSKQTEMEIFKTAYRKGAANSLLMVNHAISHGLKMNSREMQLFSDSVWKQDSATFFNQQVSK